MQTKAAIVSGIAALIVAALFYACARKPRERYSQPKATDAEIVAKRLKSWEAYAKERAGSHTPPPTQPLKQERQPENDSW